MPKLPDRELLAYFATLGAITVLGLAAVALATHDQKEAAAALAGICTGLIGVLKMPIGGNNG